MKFENFFDENNKHSLYRILLIITAIVVIFSGSIFILYPFFPAILLSVIFCLSTWRAFRWLENKLGNRTTLAALLMTMLLAVCFLLPLIFLGSSIVDNFNALTSQLSQSLQAPSKHDQDWLKSIPIAGDFFYSQWLEYTKDKEKFLETSQEYIAPVTQWVISIGASVARGLLDLTLGVIVSFFFFRHGVTVAGSVEAIIQRFYGERGTQMLQVSAKTMIGVVYGILGTAVAQGALAGFGFWMAHVPGAALLGFMTFFLSFIPMGPPLIWGGATVWLFMENKIFWAVFMAIWGTFFISLIDNVIRPYFISLGSNLPLLLVLFGVFGGIVGFGFIGLFIGPTLLALAYTLIREWSRQESPKVILHPVE